MIPYILYTALVLTASFVFYKLLLQKETFFYLNRYVLLICMMLAFMLPLLPVPQQWSFRKDTTTVTISHNTPDVYTNNTTPSIQQNTYAPAEPAQEKQTITLQQIKTWIIYLYWFGVIVFGLNFLMQAIILLYKAYSNPIIKDGKFRIVETSDDKAPCSFGNNIFINPAKYDWETYNQILLHEKIHIEQKHTLDLLLAEIVLIFQWFNPFAWLWRKELENNLEFLTDNKLLQQTAVEKASYQMSLLKVAAPYFPLALTTNYNQSLLKKRLLMMNTKKSNVHTLWKYFFLLPFMILFVCLFNEPVAISQTNEEQKTAKSKNGEEHHGIKTEGNWFATIKGDKINIQFRNDDDENSYNSNTFLLSEFKDLPRDKTGTFTLTREAGSMEFTGKFEGDKGMGTYKFTPDKNYSADMKKENINLSSDEDMMVFFFVNIKRSYVQMLKQNGYTNLDKDDLIPLAALDINEAYIKSIKEAGFSDISPEDLIPFRSLGVDKAYIEEIRKAGYPNISPDKIITFKAQGINGKYIADFRSSIKKESDKENENNNVNDSNSKNKNNEKNKDEYKNEHKNDDEDGEADEDAMISYKALNITNEYVQSLKNAGYDNLSTNNIISMKSLGVTADYIKGFRDAGYTNIPADELISLKAQNITPAQIKEYKSLGVGDADVDEVVSAVATGTTPALIKEYQSLGFKNLRLDDIISAKSTGTTPALIKEYRSLGFGNLSLEDIISAKATGTTPGLIKEYRSLGFENLDLGDIVSAVATGTTPSFITSMKQKGHNMKSLEKYVALKSVLQ